MSDLMPEPDSKKGSVTLSCRIDKALYDLLQRDCKDRGISLNSLVNSIAKKYISWEKYAAEIGYIPLARETIRLIFENLDEKTIQTIAGRVGRTVPREMTLLMFKRVDFNSIVSFMTITSSRYGMVEHTIKGDTHELIVHHRVSKKFSNFLAEVGRVMADDLSFKFEILSADSKVLAIRIEEV